MKVDLLVDKSADEIAEVSKPYPLYPMGSCDPLQIWKTYHSNKDSVCAIIPVSCFVI